MALVNWSIKEAEIINEVIESQLSLWRTIQRIDRESVTWHYIWVRLSASISLNLRTILGFRDWLFLLSFIPILYEISFEFSTELLHILSRSHITNYLCKIYSITRPFFLPGKYSFISCLIYLAVIFPVDCWKWFPSSGLLHIFIKHSWLLEVSITCYQPCR